MNKDDIKQGIQVSIEEGSLDIAKDYIKQYKNIYGYSDEIASMEAIVFFYNKEYKNAIECIKKGLEHNIFSSDLYCILGNIYEADNKIDKAYLCYSNALINANQDNFDVISGYIENLENNHKINVNNYSIVMLTYNNLDYTKVCIDSIRKYNGKDNCEIIIVDNNSTDGTVQWLQEQNDIKYILNKENKGFPAGCNQGIEISEKNNDIFLLNNDTVIMPNSIFNLRMGLYNEENVGATGSISNSVSYYQQISAQYDDFDDYMKLALQNNIPDDSRYEQRVKLVGFAMFIKRDVLDKVGLLDERFTPGNFEDDDLSLRIVVAGYKLLLCKDSYIHHFGSVSFKENPEKYSELLKTNDNKFMEKWSFNSAKSTVIRYDLVNLITETVDKKINILEIGCNCGATLIEVKNRYKNSNLYGLDFNQYTAKIANYNANVQTTKIQYIDLSIYEESFFDYVILGDIIEHVYNPKELLTNIFKYLKKDGYIISTIPNVMHFSIIRDLLYGNWTYQDAGILDKTHFRFFTKNEIIKMFNECGYSELNMGMNEMFTTESDVNFIEQLSNLSSKELKEEYNAYQYIIKAKKFEKPTDEIVKKCATLLRRIEFNIDIEETEKELIENLKNRIFTQDVIVETVAKYVIDKVYILNYLAIKCLEDEIDDFILILLNNAYDLEPQNLDTNYNLAYVLNMIGESNLALEYLYNLKDTNAAIEKLKEIIGGAIYE